MSALWDIGPSKISPHGLIFLVKRTWVTKFSSLKGHWNNFLVAIVHGIFLLSKYGPWTCLTCNCIPSFTVKWFNVYYYIIII